MVLFFLMKLRGIVLNSMLSRASLFLFLILFSSISQAESSECFESVKDFSADPYADYVFSYNGKFFVSFGSVMAVTEDYKRFRFYCADWVDSIGLLSSSFGHIVMEYDGVLIDNLEGKFSVRKTAGFRVSGSAGMLSEPGGYYLFSRKRLLYISPSKIVDFTGDFGGDSMSISFLGTIDGDHNFYID